jgi:hypothetical protein
LNSLMVGRAVHYLDRTARPLYYKQRIVDERPLAPVIGRTIYGGNGKGTAAPRAAKLGVSSLAKKSWPSSGETAIDFPPMQAPAAFNLSAVKEKIQAAIKAHEGQ